MGGKARFGLPTASSAALTDSLGIAACFWATAPPLGFFNATSGWLHAVRFCRHWCLTAWPTVARTISQALHFQPGSRNFTKSAWDRSAACCGRYFAWWSECFSRSRFQLGLSSETEKRHSGGRPKQGASGSARQGRPSSEVQWCKAGSDLLPTLRISMPDCPGGRSEGSLGSGSTPASPDPRLPVESRLMTPKDQLLNSHNQHDCLRPVPDRNSATKTRANAREGGAKA